MNSGMYLVLRVVSIQSGEQDKLKDLWNVVGSSGFHSNKNEVENWKYLMNEVGPSCFHSKWLKGELEGSWECI